MGWLKNERNEVRNDLFYREIIDYRVWNGSCLRAVYVVNLGYCSIKINGIVREGNGLKIEKLKEV